MDPKYVFDLWCQVKVLTRDISRTSPESRYLDCQTANRKSSYTLVLRSKCVSDIINLKASVYDMELGIIIKGLEIGLISKMISTHPCYIADSVFKNEPRVFKRRFIVTREGEEEVGITFVEDNRPLLGKKASSIRLTTHSISRAKERLKWNKKMLMKMSLRSFNAGYHHDETKSELNDFISRKCSSGNSSPRIYGENLFIFKGNTLVTIYQVDSHLTSKFKKYIIGYKNRKERRE